MTEPELRSLSLSPRLHGVQKLALRSAEQLPIHHPINYIIKIINSMVSRDYLRFGGNQLAIAAAGSRHFNFELSAPLNYNSAAELS